MALGLLMVVPITLELPKDSFTFLRFLRASAVDGCISAGR